MAKWLKHWDVDLEITGSTPKTEQKGFTFMSFGGDIKPSTRLCLWQALISKPLMVIKKSTSVQLRGRCGQGELHNGPAQWGHTSLVPRQFFVTSPLGGM